MSAQHKKLPPATARALDMLDRVESKTLPFDEFRRGCGVKTRAYYAFVGRLLDSNLIGRVGDLRADTGYTLTFAGMMALRDHRAAIAKATGAA